MYEQFYVNQLEQFKTLVSKCSQLELKLNMVRPSPQRQWTGKLFFQSFTNKICRYLISIPNTVY